MAGASFSFLDYSDEVSTVTVHSEPLTAANFDTQMSALDGLGSALEGISLGNLYKDCRKATVDASPKTRPSSSAAQRELKWLVSGYDSVLATPWSMEVPCADTTLAVEGSNEMDLTSAAWLALKAAIESVVLSIAGNAVVAVTAKLVGRVL